MVFSTTGIAYLIFSLVFGILTYRIFRYWREGKDAVSKILFYVALLFWLFGFLTAVRVIFFINDPLSLRLTIYTNAFLQAIGIALLTYFIFYVKFPKISPWFGAIPVLILGLIATYLTTFAPFNPYIEKSGAVNWGYLPASDISMAIRGFLFLITFIPSLIIYFQQYKETEDRYTKRKILGFILMFALGLIIATLDFLIINILKLGAFWRDITLIILSMVLFFTIISTRRTRVE